jgi:DNA-binding beta-propeller fold protein YncE
MFRSTPLVAAAAALWLTACSGDGNARDPAAGGDRAEPMEVAAAEAPEPARHLHVWAGDVDRADSDFLAVLDADPESPGYGRVMATVTVGRTGTWPHHTEHRMPESRHLFANGFMTGETFRFDLTDPENPQLLGSLGAAGELTHPHSYERLPNGNVLATFQGTGERNVDPGGLVELTDDGEVVRTASAADPDAGGALIRPYSLAVVPDLDRVVVTSYDMGEDMGFPGGRRERTHVVQVWRLSDLEVLATIDLPSGPGGGGDEQPGEPRVLSDGETVYVATFTCGLYHMTGLGGGDAGEPADPSAEFVHVVLRDFWIQSVPSANAVVALDVSDPAAPREVSRVTLGPRNFPHWLALDPAGGRIVVADRGDGERRLFVLTVDAETGELALDESFRDPGSDRAGVSFDRDEWPHGETGAARPHGTVFGG